MSWLFLSVTLVFMLAGLALSFWSASKAVESKRIAAEGVPVTAEIVRIEEEERHINRDDGPRIQIVYFEVADFTSADGRKIETRLWPKYDAKLVLKPGDKVEILYNFDNPEQVVEAGGKREFLSAQRLHAGLKPRQLEHFAYTAVHALRLRLDDIKIMRLLFRREVVL